MTVQVGESFVICSSCSCTQWKTPRNGKKKLKLELCISENTKFFTKHFQNILHKKYCQPLIHHIYENNIREMYYLIYRFTIYSTSEQHNYILNIIIYFI